MTQQKALSRDARNSSLERERESTLFHPQYSLIVASRKDPSAHFFFLPSLNKRPTCVHTNTHHYVHDAFMNLLRSLWSDCCRFHSSRSMRPLGQVGTTVFIGPLLVLPNVRVCSARRWKARGSTRREAPSFRLKDSPAVYSPFPRAARN